jgi:hypothetical protein
MSADHEHEDGCLCMPTELEKINVATVEALQGITAIRLILAGDNNARARKNLARKVDLLRRDLLDAYDRAEALMEMVPSTTAKTERLAVVDEQGVH